MFMFQNLFMFTIQIVAKLIVVVPVVVETIDANVKKLCRFDN